MLLLTNAVALDLRLLLRDPPFPEPDLDALAAAMRLTRCRLDRGLADIAAVAPEAFRDAARQLGISRSQFRRVYEAATVHVTPPLPGVA